MEGIKLRGKVGADGILTLQIPTALRDTELEIFLVLQPVARGGSRPDAALGWSPGFFEEVAGGWQGEPLERPAQGDYEERRPL